jgi:hypothetical protein
MLMRDFIILGLMMISLSDYIKKILKLNILQMRSVSSL